MKISSLRCLNDVTVKYNSVPSVSAQRFSLEAFKFIADHPFVFVNCHVIVCNATNPDSQCAKKCPSCGRRRREVSDHMSKVYTLAQGPLHVAREKREKRHGKVLDKSGMYTEYWSLKLSNNKINNSFHLCAVFLCLYWYIFICARAMNFPFCLLIPIYSISEFLKPVIKCVVIWTFSGRS